MLKRLFILCFLPLFAGGLLYVFFRTDSLIADLIPFQYKINPQGALLKLLLGVLPDFLWSFSFANFLYSFAFFRRGLYFHLLILFLLVSAELIQLFTGTLFVFDYYDLLAAISAFLFSFIIRTIFHEKV